MDWESWTRALKGKASTATATPKPDYGLHTLVHKDSEASGQVDIVAIHGLNGHYLKTWTDEDTGVNWLKDIIPKVVPAARVMSFWYNSTLQFSKSTSDISVFAHQLLEDIVAVRDTIEESYRPIIFICHSLGGLVFKQAFNVAKENDKYTSIANHTKGVMFFGTPHRGSGLASWANILGNVLKAASLGTSTNVQLARDLEPESKLLERISESFISNCGKIQIVSCYETSKMKFLNCVVSEPSPSSLRIQSVNIEL
ncbi:Alpha/Beta hydrolase protein [Hypoxylon sp. FL1857]|nr:Alpha/Beta hydrolase protein [Hypoxylon sp. FL1857]